MRKAPELHQDAECMSSESVRRPPLRRTSLIQSLKLARGLIAVLRKLVKCLMVLQPGASPLDCRTSCLLQVFGGIRAISLVQYPPKQLEAHALCSLKGVMIHM